MKEYDSDLSTRLLGEKIKKDLEETLVNEDNKLFLDFEGILSISHSCADEAFAILAKEQGMDNFKKRIAFINIDDDAKSVILAAIASRMK